MASPLGAVVLLAALAQAAKDIGTFAPTKKAFNIENLTVQAFNEKVVDVTNGTGKPAYIPIVMFHQPWCSHCRDTIPELEKANKKIEEAVKAGEIQLQLPVKLFFLSCQEPGADAICETHCGKSYPSIMAFRQGRAARFNRPRVADVFVFWIHRVARPPFYLLEAAKQWEGAGTQFIQSFLLRVTGASDKELLHYWEEIALDNLDHHNYFIAFAETGKWDSLPGKVPSVHVSGHPDMQLEAPPFEGEVQPDESLREWVMISALQAPAVEVDPWKMAEVWRSGLLVIALRHGKGPESEAAVKAFRSKAKELRKGHTYVFATWDVDTEDGQKLAGMYCPLLARHVEDLLPGSPPSPPRIFVLSGKNGEKVYWEDPTFPEPAELSLEAVERLVADPEAFQDGSWASTLKAFRKRYSRFASRSAASLMIAIASPIVAVFLNLQVWRFVWKALFSNDDEEQEKEKKES